MRHLVDYIILLICYGFLYKYKLLVEADDEKYAYFFQKQFGARSSLDEIFKIWDNLILTVFLNILRRLSLT